MHFDKKAYKQSHSQSPSRIHHNCKYRVPTSDYFYAKYIALSFKTNFYNVFNLHTNNHTIKHCCESVQERLSCLGRGARYNSNLFANCSPELGTCLICLVSIYLIAANSAIKYKDFFSVGKNVDANFLNIYFMKYIKIDI